MFGENRVHSSDEYFGMFKFTVKVVDTFLKCKFDSYRDVVRVQYICVFLLFKNLKTNKIKTSRVHSRPTNLHFTLF